MLWATCKAYALNDQESGRNAVNVNIDQRAARESDLLAFEIGLTDSDIAAVMCSYNRLHGVYACENKYLFSRSAEKRLELQRVCGFRLGRHAQHRKGLCRRA